MPFRAKLKRAFGGNSSDDYELSNPLTHAPKKKSKRDFPENIYKPGEAMPRPKYRGPWNQAHQDKLSAFSFGDAWKKRKSSSFTNKSVQEGTSEYSPMGSRIPSRAPSRRGSTLSAFHFPEGKRALGMGSRQHSEQKHQDVILNEKVEENDTGDNDVMNAGLWREPSHDEKPPPPPPKNEELQLNGLTTEKTIINAQMNGNSNLDPLGTQRMTTNGRISTADELANAMSQSTLRSSKRETQDPTPTWHGPTTLTS